MGVIHPQATTEDIIKGHVEGKNAYQIAEEYGMDENQVAVIIREQEAKGAFVPKGTKKEED